MRVFFKSEFGKGITNEERNEAVHLAMSDGMIVNESFTSGHTDCPSFKGDGVVELSSGKKVRVRTEPYRRPGFRGGIAIDNVEQMTEYIEYLEALAIPSLPLAVIKYGARTLYDEKGELVGWTMPESVIKMSKGRKFKATCDKYGKLNLTAI